MKGEILLKIIVCEGYAHAIRTDSVGNNTGINYHIINDFIVEFYDKIPKNNIYRKIVASTNPKFKLPQLGFKYRYNPYEIKDIRLAFERGYLMSTNQNIDINFKSFINTIGLKVDFVFAKSNNNIPIIENNQIIITKYYTK